MALKAPQSTLYTSKENSGNSKEKLTMRVASTEINDESKRPKRS